MKWLRPFFDPEHLSVVGGLSLAVAFILAGVGLSVFEDHV
jgi:hypothetical protein